MRIVADGHAAVHRNQHRADLVTDGHTRAQGVIHALSRILDFVEAAVADGAGHLRGSCLDGSDLDVRVGADHDMADGPAMVEADIDHGARWLHGHGTEDSVAVHGGLNGRSAQSDLPAGPVVGLGHGRRCGEHSEQSGNGRQVRELLHGFLLFSGT